MRRFVRIGPVATNPVDANIVGQDDDNVRSLGRGGARRRRVEKKYCDRWQGKYKS
jgi:hypothetical protein